MDYAFNDYISEGYSRKMQVALAYRDGKFLENVPDFETSLMLPEIYEPEDAGKTYYFMPIHFRERCGILRDLQQHLPAGKRKLCILGHEYQQFLGECTENALSECSRQGA